MVFDGMLQNDQLSGTITTPKGDKYPFTGVRAPLLKRTTPPVWGKPIALFNGKNLDGWHMSGKEKQWVVEDGILKSPKSGSNIITDATFTDFKLHIELRYPAGSNSGVYLRGRYEVQVEDNYGLEPSSTLFGGIYGFLTPNDFTIIGDSILLISGDWLGLIFEPSCLNLIFSSFLRVLHAY